MNRFFCVPLADEIRHATAGHSGYHSLWFIEQCPSYHVNGRNWPKSELDRFFKEGLLRHYMGIVSTYHADYAYENVETLIQTGRFRNYDYDLLTQLFSHLGLSETIGINRPIIEWVQDDKPWFSVITTLFDRVMQLDKLLSLGGEYQKIKQEIEVLNKRLQASPNRDQDSASLRLLQNELLAKDAELEKKQWIIYNWVRFASFEIREFLKENKYDIGLVTQHLPGFQLTIPPFAQDDIPVLLSAAPIKEDVVSQERTQQDAMHDCFIPIVNKIIQLRGFHGELAKAKVLQLEQLLRRLNDTLVDPSQSIAVMQACCQNLLSTAIRDPILSHERHILRRVGIVLLNALHIISGGFLIKLALTGDAFFSHKTDTIAKLEQISQQNAMRIDHLI